MPQVQTLAIVVRYDYHGVVGICCRPVNRLARLPDFTIAITKLPCAVETAEEKRWPALTELGWNLNDALQGLQLYLKQVNPDPRIDTSFERAKAGQDAERQWTNVNTLCAILVCRDSAAENPVLSSCRQKCWFAIVSALEGSSDVIPDGHPNKTLGRLRVWAAAVWITIAGRETRRFGKRTNAEWPPGVLWEEQGGTHDITDERWMFWGRRFREFAQQRELTAQASGEAEEAARVISAFYHLSL